MRNVRLWISFFHQDEQIDHWAIYLDTQDIKDCDIWQASGQTFEFEHTHFRGMRPEEVANFKEKWLLRDDMTIDDAEVIRRIAHDNPVDNEGAYWDCRIFCFEVLASLEMENVLKRSDDGYRLVRANLHKKWKSDDGISHTDSSEEELDDVQQGSLDLTRVDDSDLDSESAVDGDACTSVEDGTGENRVGIQKRLLSQNSVDHRDVEKSTLMLDDCIPTSVEPQKA